MQTIFIVLLMNIWSNGEPEMIQYGTSILSESFATRINCEKKLETLSKDQNLIRENGISGITRRNIVYRYYDKDEKITQEYSCLEVNFKNVHE
jgi:hypothetical protein